MISCSNMIQSDNHYMAKWQSGNAAACKAVNAGSIPTLASTSDSASFFNIELLLCYFYNNGQTIFISNRLTYTNIVWMDICFS